MTCLPTNVWLVFAVAWACLGKQSWEPWWVEFAPWNPNLLTINWRCCPQEESEFETHVISWSSFIMWHHNKNNVSHHMKPIRINHIKSNHMKIVSNQITSLQIIWAADWLFFMHVVIAELMFRSCSDAKPSRFAEFRSFWCYMIKRPRAQKRGWRSS